jgi:sporulation protein YabP
MTEGLPQDVHMKSRRELTVTGVTEVVRFDEGEVVLCTSLGMLSVQGRQLQLKDLSLDGGQVAVEGEVCLLAYEEPRETGGWLRRLWG